MAELRENTGKQPPKRDNPAHPRRGISWGIDDHSPRMRHYRAGEGLAHGHHLNNQAGAFVTVYGRQFDRLGADTASAA